jgi:hypothetical protein
VEYNFDASHKYDVLWKQPEKIIEVITLRFISVLLFSLVGTLAQSENIEIKLFDGTVLEFPEGTDQDVINKAYKDNYEISKAVLATKSASELFELYRLALIDTRLNNPEGNFSYSYSSVFVMTGSLAAVVIEDKASEGEPSFLLPAARILAGHCFISQRTDLGLTKFCDDARTYLETAISDHNNPDAMAYKAKMVEDGEIGFSPSNLLASDLFFRAAEVYWGYGLRDLAIVNVDNALRTYTENTKAKELLQAILGK